MYGDPTDGNNYDHGDESDDNGADKDDDTNMHILPSLKAKYFSFYHFLFSILFWK